MSGRAALRLAALATLALAAFAAAQVTWSGAPDLPTARAEIAAAARGSEIYVAGGLNRFGRPLRAVEAYDPATGGWSRAPDLPSARHGLAPATLDGRWYAIGGGRRAGLSVSGIVEVLTP